MDKITDKQIQDWMDDVFDKNIKNPNLSVAFIDGVRVALDEVDHVREAKKCLSVIFGG